jgi:hypothetical protein
VPNEEAGQVGQTPPPRYTIHVVDVATRRITRSIDVSGEIPLPPGSVNGERRPDELRRVRLRAHGRRLHLLLASGWGVVERSSPALDDPRAFLLPYDRAAAKQRHSITMLRGLDLLSVSCESVSVSPDGAMIYCGYADNEDHPRISGELRVWDARTAAASAALRFPGAVQALAAASDGVVVGTDDNGASSWRYEGSWRLLNEVRHGAPVVAVACSEARGLACSVSRDGALTVWPRRGGAASLRTFVDVEPVHVGFSPGARRVHLVDRTGEVHVWEIENYITLAHVRIPATTNPS